MSRNGNSMVTTAIYFKSPGITSLFLFVLFRYLRIKFFRRQLDGFLRMEVSIVLLNLLGAVSPCMVFLRSTTDLGVYLFVESAGPLPQTSQPLLHISQKISMLLSNCFKSGSGTLLSPLLGTDLYQRGHVKP